MDGDLLLISGNWSLLRRQKLTFSFVCVIQYRMAACGKSFFSPPTPGIAKQDLACCVNASITSDTIASDLSSWVKLSTEEAKQGLVIRKQITHPM